MPYLCKKEKGNIKNFNLKKNSIFFWVKNFFGIFLEIFFFALNQPKKGFRAKKIFQKISKKIYDTKYFFSSKENFYHFLFLFCKGKA